MPAKALGSGDSEPREPKKSVGQTGIVPRPTKTADHLTPGSTSGHNGLADGLGSLRNSQATAGKGGTMANKSILDQIESGERGQLNLVALDESAESSGFWGIGEP